MRKRNLVLLAVLGSVLAGAAWAPAQPESWKDVAIPPLKPFSIPQPEKTALPNGLTVFLLPDHELPLVRLTATIRTGGRDVPPDKAGFGDVFGEVWRSGGTKTRTGDQIDDFLESRAAIIETSMEDARSTVSMDCLKADFPQVFPVFLEVLRSPAFAEDRIDIAKSKVNAGIARRNDSPAEIAMREARKLGYGAKSPYARVPEYATVASITRDDLLAWHAKYVHPNRTILGITGDFDPKAMLATIEKEMGPWPKGPDFQDPEAWYDKEGRPGFYFVEKADVTKASVTMVHLGGLRSNPDFHALEVMNQLFGGGMSSRLFSNVRSKKGLGYSVWAWFQNGYQVPGLFQVSLDTKNESVAAGLDALFEELDGITGKVPVTDDEVSRAKDAILNSFIFSFDSPAKILNQQVLYAYFGYPADFLQKYREGIEKVTRADVERVAKQYVRRDRLSVLVVGKSADFDRPLTSFGPVTPIIITIPKPDAGPKMAATEESKEKGRAILRKAVEAHGGKAKIEWVREVETKALVGRVTFKGEAKMLRLEQSAPPDRFRQVIDFPLGKVIVVVSPDGNFIQSGVRKDDLRSGQRDQILEEMRRDWLAVLRSASDPKLQVAYLGQQTVDGRETDTIEVENAGASVRLCVDQATGRVVRVAHSYAGISGSVEETREFSDFREVQGVWLPFTVKVLENGTLSNTETYDYWKLNPGFDPALFRPEGEEGKPAARKSSRDLPVRPLAGVASDRGAHERLEFAGPSGAFETTLAARRAGSEPGLRAGEDVSVYLSWGWSPHGLDPRRRMEVEAGFEEAARLVSVTVTRGEYRTTEGFQGTHDMRYIGFEIPLGRLAAGDYEVRISEMLRTFADPGDTTPETTPPRPAGGFRFHVEA